MSMHSLFVNSIQVLNQNMRGKTCHTQANQCLLPHKSASNFRRGTLPQQDIPKTQMSMQTLISHLTLLHTQLDNQYDQILRSNISPLTKKCFSSNFFRFEQVWSVVQLQERYGAMMQCVEILRSRLRNGQKLTASVYVKDQEQFLSMFRLYFSKPYTILQQKEMRMVLSMLWEGYKVPKPHPRVMHLKLWLHGIVLPIHPNLNHLHRAAIESPETIGEITKMKTKIYSGINEADAIGLTPFMVAAIVCNQVALLKLIKYGAKVGVCPLTLKPIVKGNINNIKNSNATMSGNGSNNIRCMVDDKGQRKKMKGIYKKLVIQNMMFSRQWNKQKRMQFDGLQILRKKKRVDLIGDIFYEQSVAKVRQFKQNLKYLKGVLSEMPDCTFQIDWREQKRLLFLRNASRDIVNVSKQGLKLRIDYHQQGLECSKNKNCSIILDCTDDVSFLLLRDHSREIIDLLKEVDLKAMQEALNLYMKEGNVTNQRIKSYEGTLKDENLNIQWQSVYENVINATEYNFKSVQEYIAAIMKSNLINYALIQNQEQAFMEQNIIKMQSKVQSNQYVKKNAIQLSLIKANELNFTHTKLILELLQFVYPSSTILNALNTVHIIINAQCSKKQKTDFPLSVKFLHDGIQIWAEVKNICFGDASKSFTFSQKAVQLNFTKNVGDACFLKKLQETVYVDELKSLRASIFLNQNDNSFQQQNFNDVLIQDDL